MDNLKKSRLNTDIIDDAVKNTRIADSGYFENFEHILNTNDLYNTGITSNAIIKSFIKDKKLTIQCLVYNILNSNDIHVDEKSIIDTIKLIDSLNNTLFIICTNKSYLYLRRTFELNDAIQESLTYLKAELPYLKKPKDWIRNIQTIKIDKNNYATQSIFLGNKLKRHDRYVNYEFLNILQKVPLCINNSILEHPQSRAFISEDFIKCLHRTQDADWHVKNSFNLLNYYSNKIFYKSWGFDERGRSYDRGSTLLKLQSKETAAHGLIDIKSKNNNVSPMEKRLILDNLKIYFIDCLDKELVTKLNSYQKRIRYFNKIYPKLHNIFNDNIDNVKHKFQYYNSAYKTYLNIVSVTNNNLMINATTSTDATSSVFQILSILLRDEDLMKICNVLPSHESQSAYDFAANEMNKYLNSKNKVSRNLVKKPLMTNFYNSKAVPRRAFNKIQLEAFYKMLMSPVFEKSTRFKELLNSNIQILNKNYIEWFMPNGHTSRTVNISPIDTTFAITHKNKVFNTRFRHNTITNFTSPTSIIANLIQSIDSYLASQVVIQCSKKNIDVYHIHDRYFHSPRNSHTVLEIYNKELKNLYINNTLKSILNNIGLDVSLPDPKSDVAEQISKATYSLF